MGELTRNEKWNFIIRKGFFFVKCTIPGPGPDPFELISMRTGEVASVDEVGLDYVQWDDLETAIDEAYELVQEQSDYLEEYLAK
jgi:hypothetical protein